MAQSDWRCGASRTLPLDHARAWDGEAAAQRMLDAAGIGTKNARPEAAKRGFLLYDAHNPGVRTSYTMPIADIVDGKLTAVEGGVQAAARRLPTMMSVPAIERRRAEQILAAYGARATPAVPPQASGTHRTPALRPLRAARAHMLPHLAHRMFNTPLALHPAKAEIIVAALADRVGVSALFRADGSPVRMGAELLGEQTEAPDRGYEIDNGVAVIPICGTLVQNLGSIRPMSGMTGYDGISRNMTLALNDPDVRGIVLDIDSPGGEVSGLFDLVDAIYAARAQKPIWAILAEHAYSSAYAIASAAHRIIVPRTGGVGSIGVIALLADISQMLQKGGITVNVIQFGARKADGLEVLPLSPEARQRFQADIDRLGELFVSTVARNRSLDPNLVRATEADAFMGAEGVGLKLADAVMAPEAAFTEFLNTL